MRHVEAADIHQTGGAPAPGTSSDSAHARPAGSPPCGQCSGRRRCVRIRDCLRSGDSGRRDGRARPPPESAQAGSLERRSAGHTGECIAERTALAHSICEEAAAAYMAGDSYLGEWRAMADAGSEDEGSRGADASQNGSESGAGIWDGPGGNDRQRTEQHREERGRAGAEAFAGSTERRDRPRELLSGRVARLIRWEGRGRSGFWVAAASGQIWSLWGVIH